MLNPLVRYGVSTVLCIGITGFCLLCVRYLEQHPSTRMYRTLPLTLAEATGACSLYLLLQTLLPVLDTPWFDNLGVFLMYCFSILVTIFFLCRARYVEDTLALLALLLVLCICFLLSIASVVPHPAPSSLVAFGAAWCAIGSIALLPCKWFDRWLTAHLGPLLPLHAFPGPTRPQRSPSRKDTNRGLVSIAGALTALALVTALALQGQMGAFINALPWAAALLVGLYLLGTASYWGIRWLLQGRTVYRSLTPPPAAWVTIIAEPFDEQANRHLYNGPAEDGAIPAEIQAQMDALLQSGEALCIHYTFDNGLQGSQHLPSYCTGNWLQCRACTCRMGAQLSHPQQGRE